MKRKLILGSFLAFSLAANAWPYNLPDRDDEVPCDKLGKELIINGDFNSGNTNFTSGYSYMSACTLGLWGDGSTINTYDISQVTSCYGIPDRSGVNGYALHFPDIQGTNVGQVFWEQSPITVTPGKTYKLSLWVYEPTGNCFYQTPGTNFDVYINTVLIQADVVGGCGFWYNKVYTWHSASNTTAQIEVKTGAAGNYNLDLSGMDLLLDDISFKECIPPEPCRTVAAELIINGDFNAGNTNFTSGYSYMGPCSLGLWGNGTTINTYDINQVTSCYGIPDRSGANGYAIHFPDIQGTNVGQVFWEQSPISVTPWRTYNLSLWVYEPTGNCAYQALGTNFDVYINNVLIQADIVGSCSSWNNKIYTWNSNANPTAAIEIRTGAAGNFNLNLSGMDLLIDDISFKECVDRDNPDDHNPTGRKQFSGLENSQNNSRQDLSIMPNPSNGNTVLKSSVDMEIKIINELGQIIRSISLNDKNNHTVLLDNLNEGIYFINSNSDTNFSQRKLIITK